MPKCSAGTQHWLGQALEGRLAGHELVHTRLEPALTDLAELEAEAAQDAPQA